MYTIIQTGSSELCHEQNKRAILAELSCGPSDAIKSIFELSTCNYIIKVRLSCNSLFFLV